MQDAQQVDGSEEPEVQPAPSHLSHSQVTTYLSCPQRYKLSRLDKVTERPAWYFAGGSAVHSLSEAYDKALFAQEGR